MDRRAGWIIGIIFGGLFLCLFAFLALTWYAFQGERGTTFSTGPRVGVVEVTGVIADAKKTLKELRDFAEADSIKAIVLRVDSPGGAVAPSQEIYEAVRKLHGKKHVVVSMGSIAASGGFYIACAAEKVFADPGTLTGSIGVIFNFYNVQGLLKWAGVQVSPLTAGKMKDAGSPYREMTPEERAYFKGVLDDVHDQFIEAVAKGRSLSVEQVKPVADGRVFTGRQAKELKLVDEMGGLEDAVAEAGRMGGIKGQPKMEYPRKDRRVFAELFGDDAQSLFEGAAARVEELVGSAGLQARMVGPAAESR
ncbi:MAG: signal peptide peptidase SppA [Myxococcaceae bacterium]